MCVNTAVGSENNNYPQLGSDPFFQYMTSFALLFTLSAIGISEMVYLVRTRISAQKPICPIGGDCHVVLTSKWSRIFIVPNDILGLLNYIGIAFLSAFLVIGFGPVSLWFFILKVIITLTSLLSLFFVYLQWKVIKAWCFWCVMSACTFWLMGIIILVNIAT